jgi:hypothetical protein
MLKPDVYLNIKFYETCNGGRKGPTPSDFFGCIFKIDDQNFDGRMLLAEISSIYPVDCKERVPVKFLNYDNVKNKLHIGKKIYIRDGGTVGEAIVVDFTE